jgi:U4/U6.U5 tri-snRNP-associated protein 2
MEPDTKRQRTEASSNAVDTSNNDAAVPMSRDLYLDTINRHMLDFDFEKVCSVSMSNINIYACLVCGNYFQGTDRAMSNSFVTNLSYHPGRGKSSHAYFHSMHKDHHVFLNLHTLKVNGRTEGKVNRSKS